MGVFKNKDIGDFKERTKYGNIADSFTKNTQDFLLIYSPTSLSKIEFTAQTAKNKISTRELSKDVNALDEAIAKIPPHINQIISIGGGTAIDIGKYIAYKTQEKMVAIPSMLSTNVYATSKVALILNGQKITLPAKMPDKILVDKDFIEKSSKFNLYGLADIFSIYTALRDWQLASEIGKEDINSKIYTKAQDLFKEALNFVLNNSLTEIEKNVKKIYEIVGDAGLITNEYGTGRPESGSEHILAKEIEHNINIYHGISVSVSVIIMSLIQNRPHETLYRCLSKIGVLDNLAERGITREILLKILENLKARPDRYSIVNTYSRDTNFLSDILDKYEHIIDGGGYVNY